MYSDVIDMESVGVYLKEVLATHLPENVDNITLNLRAEVINTPFYHYTHGLKSTMVIASASHTATVLKLILLSMVSRAWKAKHTGQSGGKIST